MCSPRVSARLKTIAFTPVPFTYVVIDETPVGQWGIAGVPMPDLGYLIGDEHAAVIAKSNQMMKDAVEQMAQEAAQADKPAA